MTNSRAEAVTKAASTPVFQKIERLAGWAAMSATNTNAGFAGTTVSATAPEEIRTYQRTAIY